MNPRLRSLAGKILLALLVAVLAAGPVTLFTTGYGRDVARLALYLGVLTASWSFLSGVAGQFSFAHVALAGAGGYAGAIWSARMSDHGWIAGVGPSIAVGAAFGAGLAFLLGLLLHRLSGAYLALFTIAFAEVARLVAVAETDLTGGRLSLAVRPSLPGSETAHYYVMLALLVATVAGLHALLRTSTGLKLRAMREDATAAAAMGVNVRAHKLFALSLAGGVAALAGSVYFHTADRISPENLDLILMSQVIAYAVIGGLESPLAAAIAAVAGSIVLENLREVRLDADQVVLLAVGVVAVPAATAALLSWRSIRRTGHRPLLTAVRAALPWALPGLGLFAWWLHAPPGAIAANGTTAGWLTLAVAGVLMVRAGRRSGTAGPGISTEAARPAADALVALLVTAIAALLGGKLYTYLEIDTELGVWRLAVFGALLAVVLRAAPNGLFTPLLDWFTAADQRRALAVRHRDAPPGDRTPEPAPAHVTEEAAP